MCDQLDLQPETDFRCTVPLKPIVGDDHYWRPAFHLLRQLADNTTHELTPVTTRRHVDCGPCAAAVDIAGNTKVAPLHPRTRSGDNMACLNTTLSVEQYKYIHFLINVRQVIWNGGSTYVEQRGVSLIDCTVLTDGRWSRRPVGRRRVAPKEMISSRPL